MVEITEMIIVKLNELKDARLWILITAYKIYTYGIIITR